MEVPGGCGGLSCSIRGAIVDGRCRSVDVSTGSGGGKVYPTDTTIYYDSVCVGGANFACVKVVGVGTTA